MASLDHVYLPGTGSPPSAPAAAAEHLNHGGFRGWGSLAVVFLAPIGISSASGPPERVIAVVLGWHDGDHALGQRVQQRVLVLSYLAGRGLRG